MRVSFNARFRNVKDSNGFGYVTKMCKRSLSRLGYTVDFMLPNADVEVCFSHPEHWQWTPEAKFRVAYYPWESSKFKPGVIEALNTVDAVWTPSEVVKSWMLAEGVQVPVYVYHHGVEPLWKAHRRSGGGKFRVLHHGAEAVRKNPTGAMEAFMTTLGDDSTLVMKATIKNFFAVSTPRIETHLEPMPIDELVKLYQGVDLMLHPSFGEGFGLPPLQAMATGMPVLITKGWAPYEYLLDEQNLIESELVDSPWQNLHPGKMFRPDMDDMRAKLQYHHDNRELEVERAMQRVDQVLHDFDWDTLTAKAFNRQNVTKVSRRGSPLTSDMLS